MRTPESVSTAVERLDRLGPFALLTRVLIAVAAGVCWVTAGSLGGFNGFITLLLVIAVAPAVFLPDSLAPMVLVMVMTAGWLVEVQPLSPAWSLVLAICGLVVHVASARAATLVEGSAFDARAGWLWLKQTGLVAAGTVVVWIVVLRLSDSPGSSGIAITAAAFVAVAALGVALAVTSVPSDGDPPARGSKDGS